MLNIPILARAFALLLIVISFLLAGENTLISADVLHMTSGSSILASAIIAIACTAIEMANASWIMRGRSLTDLRKLFREDFTASFMRLLIGGLVLARVYHFDITTTYKHPSLNPENSYFFNSVVAAFVFGPELLILIGWWVWCKARETETQQLKTTNHKVADNAYYKSQREQLVRLAQEAGKAKANNQAVSRWGPGGDEQSSR